MKKIFGASIVILFVFYSVLKAEDAQKTVCLTFDDGPTIITANFLDILDKENIKATFFVVGKQAQNYPLSLKEILARGHRVENHSYSHKVLMHITEQEAIEEIKKCSDIIKYFTGYQPLYFRPPYGAVKKREEAIIKNLGYEMIMWDIDSCDWKSRKKEELIERIKNDFLHSKKQNIIILFHEKKITLQALPEIIKFLKAQNCRFAKIEDIY